MKVLVGEGTLVSSTSGSLFIQIMSGSKIGDLTGQKIMQMLSDKNTDFIDQRAMQNYSSFYPDGFSYKNIDHFRQI